MKVIVENSAKKGINDIFYFNMQYSLQNAINTDYSITEQIKHLAENAYLGRYIPEFSDKHFREIIFHKNKQNAYRIMYYINDSKDTIRVFNIINSKQNFNRILTMHNFFKNYFKF